jgi:hypothetical protein
VAWCPCGVALTNFFWMLTVLVFPSDSLPNFLIYENFYFTLCIFFVSIWRTLDNTIIQGVSEMRVVILTKARSRQSIKLFSITFCKNRRNFQRFLPPNFYQTSRFAWLISVYFFVTMKILILITYLIFSVTM